MENRGRASIFDKERSGRPKSATTNDMIHYVHKIVMNDRQLTLTELAEAAGIPYKGAHNILHKELGIRKLNAHYFTIMSQVFQTE